MAKVFNEFIGLAAAGDKRIYGSQYASSVNNVVVKDGCIESRPGSAVLATQKQSQTYAVGICPFNSSQLKVPTLIGVCNYNSTNAAIAVFRSRRINQVA